MRQLLLGLMFVLLLIGTQNLSAGTITSAKKGRLDALVVTYTPDPTGTSSSDEMTITVTTALGTPSVADRNLRVELFIANAFGQFNSYWVDVPLAQGAMSATAKLHYCHPTQYSRWVVELYEDGRSIASPKPAPSYSNSPQTHRTLDIVGASGGRGLFTNQVVAGAMTDVRQISVASEDWRSYLAFDAVAIELAILRIASAAQQQALSTYALSGGSLAIHSTPIGATPDGDAAILAEVDKLLYGPELSSSSSTSGSSRAWATAPVVHRIHGGGQLFVLPQSPANFTDSIRSSINYPVSDFATNGDADFQWFWRNLVTTVGKTPIWGFIAFVSLFVLVVGPLLLQLTTKLRHRTLLLVLIPAISLVATILVLIYNVVREGFGTQGRVAAVQYYDANSQIGFTWSRQSYFSGAPPGEGLKFPGQALVRPQVINWNQSYQVPDPRDHVNARIGKVGDQQLLTRWSIPRSQQSLLVGQRSDQLTLPFEISRLADNSIKLTNKSESALAMVVLRQSAEVGYLATDLPAGESIDLVAQSLSDIDRALRLASADLAPQGPPDIDLTSRRSYRNLYNYISTTDPINNALRKLNASQLSNYGFLLIRNQVPEISLPFDKTVYTAERHFHLMTGVTAW
jgi:hypothetical protein